MTSCWVSVLPPCSIWPGTHVHPHCARDPNRIDTVMSIELPVLDRRQRPAAARRHFLRRDHDAIFAVDGEDAADQQRLEARDRHILAVAVAQALDPLLTRDDSQNGGRTGLVGEARRTQRDVQARALLSDKSPGARADRRAGTAAAATRARDPTRSAAGRHRAPAERRRSAPAVSIAAPRIAW